MTEALSWLKQYPKGLAGNRFDQPGMAEAYIQTLYQLGAVSVEVELPGPDDQPDYTSTLIVKLPQAPEQRQSLFDCYRKEAEELGEDFGGEDSWVEFDSTANGEPTWKEEALEDQGQQTLTFWWD